MLKKVAYICLWLCLMSGTVYTQGTNILAHASQAQAATLAPSTQE